MHVRETTPGGTPASMEETAAYRDQSVAGMASLGSVEATIAQVGARLERLSDEARTSRREERRLRSEERREEIRAMKTEARWRLAQGIFSGAGEIGAGLASAAGEATGNKSMSATGGVFKGEMTVYASVAGAGASRAQRRARRANLRATEAGERAQDDQDSMEALRRSADKAARSLEEIARAQHESTMAAARA